MPRPRKHSDAAARRIAFMQDKDRFDLVVPAHIGSSIRELATYFDTSNSDVIADLLRFALTNRNWKSQGLLWSAHGPQK